MSDRRAYVRALLTAGGTWIFAAVLMLFLDITLPPSINETPVGNQWSLTLVMICDAALGY